ncbi:MAG: translocation/assembly module TamB domain-containing protein [Anaerovibrio sp.]|uniref:translocation/assembly module TamB domain-containing protein n=1 Tax=Anaerovibrio sp. TaxID=1872532 RepID=UPI0025E3BEB3|nr:translocation/assembly module TamB domain-containing protein [Anaerovibrio sp.]MCR5176200.1 translocation/assembly module TamB domain-containing protein [Anaerovibrio sp.]
MDRKLVRLVGILVGCITLVLAASYWYLSSSSSFMAMAAENAAATASDVLETRVDIGLVRVDAFNTVEIKDISVYDKQNELIAKVADAKVGFSIFGMLKDSPAEGISDVYLDGVEGTVRQRSDGSWNFSDLISEEPSENKFVGKVHITNSSLLLGINGQETLLEDLNANLDFDGYPAIRLEGSGKNQGADMRLTASIGGARETFDVELHDVALANYVPMIPAGIIPEDIVRDISGNVTSLMVSGEKVKDDLYYTGQLELRDGHVTILDTRVEDIGGLVLFDEKEAQVFMRASTSGQEATAKGKVKLVEGRPILDLTVASDGFEPGVLIADIPYSGPVKFSARVVGDATNPVVDALVGINEGSVDGYSFHNGTAKVRYDEGNIAVNEFGADVFGGRVTGVGNFDAKSRDFAVKAEVAGIEPRQLDNVLPALSGISGRISGEVLLDGNINNIAGTKAVGTVKSSDMGWNGIETTALDGSFIYENNNIHIDYISLIFATGGELGLHGDIIANQGLDIDFYSAGLDMSMARAIDEKIDISGYADIKGHIKGTFDDPKVKASFAARDGSIFSQPFDRLHGKAGGSLRGIKISDFVMEHGEDNRWSVKGVMGFMGKKGVNLEVVTQNARMENMLKSMGIDFPLTGNVDNIIKITGTLDDPVLTGQFDYHLGSYNSEIVIQSIKGTYDYKDDVLTLKDVNIVSPGIIGRIDNGTVNSNGDMNIKLVARGMDIDAFSNKLPIPITGLFDFEGQLTGNIKSPFFHGTVASKSLSIRGESFDDVSGNIDYRNHTVYFSDMYMKQGTGKYTLNAEYNMNYRMIGGNVQIIRGDIRSLVAMGGWKDNKVTGKLNGNFNVSGTVDNPSVSMSAYLDDGKLGNYSLTDVACEAIMENRVITISSLSGQEGQTGKFTALGTVDLDGDISLTADMSQIDAGAVAGAAGYTSPVDGKIDCHLEAAGELDNPVAQIDLLVTDFGAHGAKLDTMTGKFLVKDKTIRIVDKLVARKMVGKTDNKVLITGEMPIRALLTDDEDDEAQLNLNISLEDADLSLLPTISNYIDWAVGSTDGSVKITGTLSHPCFEGIVTIPDGAYKIKGIEKPVTDASMKIMLMGNNITLEKCVGIMGKGSYSMSGYVTLDGLKPVDYHFVFDSDGLNVKSNFFKGALNSTVQIDSVKMPAGMVGDEQLEERVIPKISGKLFLENVVLSTPPLLDDSSDMPEVALDYDVELGKGVRFVSANLGDLRLVGSAHFGGTTLQPKTSGAITVKKGTITYLKTPFNVVEGVIKFDRFETLLPSISLKAGTKISNTRVFASLSGPVENMKFRLMSSPAMSEKEIIQLLTLRSEYNSKKSDSSQFSSMFSVGLQMTILSEVETAMRNVLNLDLFSVERDTTEFGDEKTGDKNYFEVYNIKMGKEITDRFMLQYTKSINSDKYRAGFEYELNDNMSFAYYRDEKNANVFGLKAQFRFSTASPRSDVDDEKIYRDNMGYRSVRR